MKQAAIPRNDFPFFFPDERLGERALLAVTRSDLRDLSLKPSSFGAFICRDDYKRIVFRFDRNTDDGDIFFLFDDRRGGVIKFLTTYKHKYGHVPNVVQVEDAFGAQLMLTLSGPPRPKQTRLARTLNFFERRATGLIWLVRHTRWWESTIDIWRICP